ncbi:hypothetical protein GCM10017581_068510 [Dactylosporangium matsuzakiense]|uniref:Transposase IS116/IS110/IS902 C-terminal domain-containing protein n=1 Tax=Dactylosporangium matsuzakiense TaxID=53360 RepID=A0A9W6KR31_9ACTN|nr:hypothetical protein GCM10017581_068510 [Dactylosporangium matsuzakiense]
MRAGSPRLANTLPARITAALSQQTVTVPGTTDFGPVIAGVARQLRDIHRERAQLATDLETRLADHPLAQVLTSMPGIGVRTCLKILTIIGDGSAFPTPGHLASYAGLAPVTRQSGSSIKGETHTRRGNHALKSALFLSAFASLAHPPTQPRLLRPQTRRRQETQRGADLPRPTPTRRHPRHAPHQQALPSGSHRLTKDIGTPPAPTLTDSRTTSPYGSIMSHCQSRLIESDLVRLISPATRREAPIH